MSVVQPDVEAATPITDEYERQDNEGFDYVYSSVARSIERKLAAALARAESAEEKHTEATDTALNEADEQWLGAIADEWNRLTGKPWDVRDGEDRLEGIRANVKFLFNHYEDRLADAVKDTEMLQFIRDHCKVIYWPHDSNYPFEHNLSAGKDMWSFIRDAAIAQTERTHP